MRRGRAVTGLLLVVGLGFALVGQFYFANRREYVWDGVLLWAVALFSFGLLLGRTERGRTERRRSGQRQRHRRLLASLVGPPARAVAVAGGAGLALEAGWLARRCPDTADFSGVFLLWLVGVVCFLLGFVPILSGNSSDRKMWQMAPTAAVGDVRQVGDVWRRLIHCCRSRRVELAGELPDIALSFIYIADGTIGTVKRLHLPAVFSTGDEFLPCRTGIEIERF